MLHLVAYTQTRFQTSDIHLVTTVLKGYITVLQTVGTNIIIRVESVPKCNWVDLRGATKKLPDELFVANGRNIAS